MTDELKQWEYDRGYEKGKTDVLDKIRAEIEQAALDAITDAIDDLPSVTPQQGWIPVSERLPKAGEYVGGVARYYLVQDEYGNMLVARYTHSEYWEQIYKLKPYADKIVAWMPLPAPFEPQESEDKE